MSDPSLPPGVRARLFVAVWPPNDVVERVAALGRPEVAGLRWTDRRQWHVTLRFLGRADVEDARQAFNGMVLPGARVEAVAGPAVGRFGQRVLQVPVAGLVGLAAAVVAATGGVGEPSDDRPFSGHLTLARAAKGVGVDLRGLTGQPVSGAWTVDAITLVESHLSSSGATYDIVARRPLSK